VYALEQSHLVKPPDNELKELSRLAVNILKIWTYISRLRFALHRRTEKHRISNE
jgi:hypothetical protein